MNSGGNFKKPAEKMRYVLFMLTMARRPVAHLLQHVGSINVDDVDWVDPDKEGIHTNVKVVSRRAVQPRLGQVDMDSEFLVCVHLILGKLG